MSYIFKLVVVSKDDKFSMSDDVLATVGAKKISNNTLPIAQCYNNILTQIRANNSNTDFVIFMHADVSLDLLSLVEHIEECADKYDIMGLCGTSKLVSSQTPLNWFCGSRTCPQHRWGCVTHGELGQQMTYFSAHSPTVMDHEVACIDGLCIIFGPNALKSGIMFDESLGKFDFYDTDLSFQALINYKLTLGVIVQKDLMHFSIGRSITTDDFLKNELVFRKKWGLAIPPGSKLETLANGKA